MVIWVTANTLIVYEAVREGEPRFSLLAMYAAMLGLPAVLNIRGKNGDGNGH